jgi:hydrogenase expression/formation protein HypE
LGLILEEGFPVAHLDKVLDSVRRASKQAGVLIAAGDTKVVGRGSADGIFINTSGIGSIPAGIDISSSNARPGDVVILSGTIGDHGIAVLSRREGMDFETEILSDTAPLNAMVEAMLRVTDAIHTMRDPTRGGLATTLNEIARKSSVGISVDESAVPIRDDVLEACEMLGFDPFYVANEGKLVAFVPEAEADAVLLAMQEAPYGERSAVIGRVLEGSQGTVVLNTAVGGKRVLAPLSGELLPRIC